MLKLAFYIGFRYMRSQHRTGFISFISWISVLGIALGVAVLITVLSVMNGFDVDIRDRIFNLSAPLTFTGLGGKLEHWPAVSEKMLDQEKSILASAPFVNGQGLIQFQGNVQAIFLLGISPEQEVKISRLGKIMTQGSLVALKPDQFNIILGEQIADNLNLSLGDRLNVVIPQASVTPIGILPRFKRFTVAGIFKSGSGLGFDNSLAYIDLSDAQKLFMFGSAVSGLHIKLDDFYHAPQVRQTLQKAWPAAYVSDWTQQFGAFFKALQLEKTMMFFILLLIIAVAVFNLISSLVMTVTDKRADIGILRTLGATPQMILIIFISQGALLGLIGTLAGSVLGVGLALNVTKLVNFLQALFHIQIFSPSIYFLDYLPSKLALGDFVTVNLTALFLSLAATLYPAWRAAQLKPIEALRYE